MTKPKPKPQIGITSGAALSRQRQRALDQRPRWDEIKIEVRGAGPKTVSK